MKPHIGSEVNLLSSYLPVQWNDVKFIWNNSYLYCGCRWKWRVIIAVNFQFKQLERRSLKKSGLQRDSNPWPPRYRCDALPTELWSHTLGARSIYWVHIFPCSEMMWSLYEIIHICTAVVDESEEWSERKLYCQISLNGSVNGGSWGSVFTWIQIVIRRSNSGTELYYRNQTCPVMEFRDNPFQLGSISISIRIFSSGHAHNIRKNPANHLNQTRKERNPKQ